MSKMSAIKFSSFEWGGASEEEESVRSEKWIGQAEGKCSQSLLTDTEHSLVIQGNSRRFFTSRDILRVGFSQLAWQSGELCRRLVKQTCSQCFDCGSAQL